MKTKTDGYTIVCIPFLRSELLEALREKTQPPFSVDESQTRLLLAGTLSEGQIKAVLRHHPHIKWMSGSIKCYHTKNVRGFFPIGGL